MVAGALRKETRSTSGGDTIAIGVGGGGGGRVRKERDGEGDGVMSDLLCTVLYYMLFL